MKRRLFNLAAGLSLVLCGATAVLWVRSYFVRDAIFYECHMKEKSFYASTEWVWQFNNGKFTAQNRVAQSSPAMISDASLLEYRQAALHSAKTGIQYLTSPAGSLQIEAISIQPREVHWFGFSHRVFINDAGDLGMYFKYRLYEYALPIWVFALIAAMMPALWVVQRVRRAQLVRDGMCPTCGYDLRATPERCPECGTVPAKPAQEMKDV